MSGSRPEGAAVQMCIVASRFNVVYVDRMLHAALEVLERHGVSRVEVVRVPGAFELPLACQCAAKSGRYAAVLALGCLIEGETDHYRLVAEAATQGLMRIGLDHGVPVLHGLLAVHDAAQAEVRTGGEVGNRGAEVALAAAAMCGLTARSGAPS